jgi:hypothetical protein
MDDVDCFSGCLANGLCLVFFMSGPNSGGNSILATCNFHMLFNSCYESRSNEAITLQLKRKDGSVGSPPIAGTRSADQSRKHPFAQLNSLSLNFYFHSLTEGL